ncbi:MAG: DUF4293 domain-containing protein [Ferruginibacter sp.]
MIQRKQTLWLLLAAACGFLSFKLPFYSGTTATEISHKLLATENFLLIITTSVISLLALVVIFLFRQRVLQLRLCILGILLEALLIFLYYREVQNFIPKTGTYSLTALLQGAIVFFYFIAAKDINRDEKMVKDSDRLR